MNALTYFKPQLAVTSKTPWLANLAAGFILGNEWLALAAAAEPAESPPIGAITLNTTPGSASAAEPTESWLWKVYKYIRDEDELDEPDPVIVHPARSHVYHFSNGRFLVSMPPLHSSEKYHEKLSTDVKDVVRESGRLWTMTPQEKAQYTRFVTFEWPDVLNIREDNRDELCNFSDTEFTENSFSMDYKNPYNHSYTMEAKYASMPKTMALKLTMKAAHGAKAKTPTFIVATTMLELPVRKSGSYGHAFPRSNIDISPLSDTEAIYIQYQLRVHRGEVLEDERMPAPFLVSMTVLKIATHYGKYQVSLRTPERTPLIYYFIYYLCHFLL
ncbi:hypothetical protein HDU98_008163 [Podochytrium sp. JEL0797]|nr:hypothetical protein HDU98_008163 [Podochytrium sp. JEL0797]